MLILTAMAACTFALIRGCYRDAINAARVRPGMSKSEVLAIMGPPAEESDGGDEWHYNRAGLLHTRVVSFNESGEVVRMYDD